MKIIFKIARAELRNLFYSPVAWFVIVVFYAFAAAFFLMLLEQLAIIEDVMQDNKPGWFGFDKGIGDTLLVPMLDILTRYIYLFIPLLIMGIINREVNSGSIKLLYSSPVGIRDIILGKYLGMVCFNLILILGVASVLMVGYCTIENAEFTWYFSILLGLFLLINAYSAIGLFISCLTNYQIVAAVVTFATFFVLSAISGLWQQYDLIRDITYFLSIAGKVEFMLRGLITSRDVMYFLLIIALFLGFSMIRLKRTQESKKWTVSFYRYALLLLTVIGLGYASSRPGHIAYFDLTKNKLNTLHPAVQDVLKEMDGSPVTVTLYTNLFASNVFEGLPQNRNPYVWNFWEKYIRFYPNIRFKYEYYYALNDGDSTLYRRYPGKSLEEIAALQAEVLGIRKSLFKEASEMKNLAALRAEYLTLIMQLEYKGKKEFLRAYEDGYVWPDQTHVVGTIRRLTRTKDVKVGFLTGHYERDPHRFTERDYGHHTTNRGGRGALINKGVDTDTISVENKNVPGDINLLVVADPKSVYSQAEQDHISQYLDSGGNALFFTEPGKQFILAPVLKKIGIHIDDGMIVSPNDHEMPHIFKNGLTKTGNFMAREFSMDMFQRYGILGGMVENAGSSNISYEEINGFRVEPVIVQPGNEKTWIENGVLVLDSAAPTFSDLDRDIRKNEYTIAVKMTRKINGKEQRIVVSGDADYMSTRRMVSAGIGHALYSWALYNTYPVYANYGMAQDRHMLIGAKTAASLKYIFVYGVPAALLLTGIILLIRRKRK